VGDRGPFWFSLYNKGRGVAKYPSVLIGLTPSVGGTWSDGEGNPQPFKTGRIEFNRPDPYQIQFMTNADVVVHPGQEVRILHGPAQIGGWGQKPISRIIFRLFAENMVPKEGSLEL
jgi:hypothetical protein